MPTYEYDFLINYTVYNCIPDLDWLRAGVFRMNLVYLYHCRGICWGFHLPLLCFVIFDKPIPLFPSRAPNRQRHL